MGVPLLRVQGLSVRRRGDETGPSLVDGVGFEVGRGEAVALLGRSGAGKSLTARAILGLLPAGLIAAGTVELDGIALTEETWPAARGRRLGMVFQESQVTLDPLFTIRQQLNEVRNASRDALDPGSAIAPAAGPDSQRDPERLLERVGLVADAILERYPHQLSGGQSQRVGIALALAGAPDLLIADEPTSAVDGPQKLALLDDWNRLRCEGGLALLLLTHDLDLVRSACQRVLVLDQGRLVERATVDAFFSAAVHPASHALLGESMGFESRHPTGRP